MFVSYYFVHVEDKLRRTPEKCAAALVKAMLPFRELVETCVSQLSDISCTSSMTSHFAHIDSNFNQTKYAKLHCAWILINGCAFPSLLDPLSANIDTMPEMIDRYLICLGSTHADTPSARSTQLLNLTLNPTTTSSSSGRTNSLSSNSNMTANN